VTVGNTSTPVSVGNTSTTPLGGPSSTSSVAVGIGSSSSTATSPAGGGGDGGTPTGVAYSDAGNEGDSLCAAALLAPISAKICDGFETMPSSFTVTPAGSMVVDTTQFYRGKQSMKFAPSSNAYLSEQSTFTQAAAGGTKATNNNFWGRYFFLSGETTIGATIQSHAVFGTMMGTDTSSTMADAFHFIGGSRGKLQTQIEFAADVFSDDEQKPAATDPSFPVAADGWQCWEWQLTSDDTYHFFINGTEITEMQIVAGVGTYAKKNFSPLPTVYSIQLGWLYFGGATGTFTGWIDEVAIGPNRIGCGN
jgi:hypothetical protein